jgi:GNAT superfamily N-acetyltransferase
MVPGELTGTILDGVAMVVRPWAGRLDTAAMQQLASGRWPHGPHAGGVGWAAAIGQLADEIAVVDGDAGLVGWAGLLGQELFLHADPAHPAAARELTDWAVQTAGAADLTVTVYDGDEVPGPALAGAGFAPQPEAAPVTGMFRDAGAGAPVLPDGYRVRSVADGEQAARVEAHRAAWRPATLPWPDGTPAVSAELTSRFSADHYDEVRDTWLYDQSRDLVIEAPDGSLAACCIVWWDPAAGTAEIEPLGVLPGHRRQGLATALCLAACAQVAELGGDQVFINTGPRADYPAPAQTYLAAGFTVVAVARVHRRPGGA